MSSTTIHINNKANYLFSKSFEGFGEVSIRPFRISQDSKVLHEWVNQDYAVFWGMQGTTLQEVEQEYANLQQPEHYGVFVGVLC